MKRFSLLQQEHCWRRLELKLGKGRERHCLSEGRQGLAAAKANSGLGSEATQPTSGVLNRAHISGKEHDTVGPPGE